MKLAITSNGVQTVFPLPKTFTVAGTSVEVNGSPVDFTWTGTNEITLDDVPTAGDRVVFEMVDGNSGTYDDVIDALTDFKADPGFGGESTLAGEVKMFVGTVPTGYTRIDKGVEPVVLSQRFAGVCAGSNTNANLNRACAWVGDGQVHFAQDRWVETYTRSTETWALRYTRTGFDRCGMAPVAGGKLLMVGGNTTVSNACIVWNPADNSVTTVANYPVTIRNSFGVLMGNGKTMVAGGTVTGGSTTAAVYEYDPVADSFTALANLPGGTTNNPILVNTALGVFNIVGAASYMYDRGTDTWTSKAAPPVTMGLDFSAGLMPDGKVIAFQTNGAVPSSFYIYDPVANTWSTVARRIRFVENKVRPAVVSTSTGNIYILGYGSTTGETHLTNWALEFPDFWATQPYYAKKD